jgi:PRTRC genetic system ThiF family protein
LLQLPFLEQALRAWGQPGLAVTVMDPDTVSEVNVVRQPFSHVDIGSNKAMCLVGRINIFWGFAWKAIPRYFGDSPAVAPECDLLISCVDTRKARHLISQSFKKFRAPAYHLDLGNNASSGQYVLGQPQDVTVSARAQEARLPTVFELYPLCWAQHNGYWTKPLRGIRWCHQSDRIPSLTIEFRPLTRLFT